MAIAHEHSAYPEYVQQQGVPNPSMLTTIVPSGRSARPKKSARSWEESDLALLSRRAQSVISKCKSTLERSKRGALEHGVRLESSPDSTVDSEKRFRQIYADSHDLRTGLEAASGLQEELLEKTARDLH